jgi:hypothetical protein
LLGDAVSAGWLATPLGVVEGDSDGVSLGVGVGVGDSTGSGPQ